MTCHIRVASPTQLRGTVASYLEGGPGAEDVGAISPNLTCGQYQTTAACAASSDASGAAATRKSSAAQVRAAVAVGVGVTRGGGGGGGGGGDGSAARSAAEGTPWKGCRRRR